MKCKNNGITLVETLVAVMILSVLALSLYTVFKSGIDAWTKSESRLEIYQNARAVLDQLSRELAGAFVTSGVTGAKLAGVDGGAGPDTLTFVTDFADSIYKIYYHLDLDATDATKKNLIREYIDYSDPANAGKGYDSTSYGPQEPVQFVAYTKSAMVSNIKFKYLPVMPSPPSYLPATALSPSFMADWNTALAISSWTTGYLPEAVKIVVTMRAVPNDPNGATYDFETIVYLPNSEIE